MQDAVSQRFFRFISLHILCHIIMMIGTYSIVFRIVLASSGISILCFHHVNFFIVFDICHMNQISRIIILTFFAKGSQ